MRCTRFSVCIEIDMRSNKINKIVFCFFSVRDMILKVKIESFNNSVSVNNSCFTHIPNLFANYSINISNNELNAICNFNYLQIFTRLSGECFQDNNQRCDIPEYSRSRKHNSIVGNFIVMHELHHLK